MVVEEFGKNLTQDYVNLRPKHRRKAHLRGEMIEQPDMKVLTVKASSRISPADIVPLAERIARTVRELHYEGFDLRFAEVRCHLVRNDRPVKPVADVGLFAGELRERPGK